MSTWWRPNAFVRTILLCFVSSSVWSVARVLAFLPGLGELLFVSGNTFLINFVLAVFDSMTFPFTIPTFQLGFSIVLLTMLIAISTGLVVSSVCALGSERGVVLFTFRVSAQPFALLHEL